MKKNFLYHICELSAEALRYKTKMTNDKIIWKIELKYDSCFKIPASFSSDLYTIDTQTHLVDT